MANIKNNLFSGTAGKRVYDNALRAISDFSMDTMIKSGVLVGLSGGADSVMLLSFLVEYRNSTSYFPIVAFHLNHSLRDEEADADEALSAKICQELGVEFISVKKDIKDIAYKNKTGIEETARNVRYSCFSEIIQGRNDVNTIAVAHNSTDNLETVIFNLMRGAGASGICGIKPVRDNVIRPLIYSTAKDVRDALNSASVSYAVDSTNTDEAYTRNYIRHTVLPALRKLNANPEEMIERASASLRLDDSFLNSEAENICNSLQTPIMIGELSRLEYPIFIRVLKILFAAYSSASLEKVHVDSIYAKRFENNFEISLPDGFNFVCDRGRCSFAVPGIAPDYERKIEFGVNEFYDFASEIHVNKTQLNDFSSNVYNFSIQLCIPSAIINSGLYIRNKKDGDTILIGGHRKKLKRVFCDMDIPKAYRSLVPVLVDDEGVVAVPGYRLRDGLSNSDDCAYLTIFIDRSKEKRFHTANEWS